VFAFEVNEPKKFIVETSKTVRGPMLMDAIANFSDCLNTAYDDVIAGSQADDVDADDGWMSDGLRHFASRTIFDAIFSTVFGRSHQHVFNPDMVFANFEAFHK